MLIRGGVLVWERNKSVCAIGAAPDLWQETEER